MREEKRLVRLSEMEQGIVIRCLNDKRTALLQEKKDTNAVDDILLKIIDAPIVKGRKERGAYAER
jgi:hypothetical protein